MSALPHPVTYSFIVLNNRSRQKTEDEICVSAFQCDRRTFRKRSNMSVWMEPHLTHKQRFQIDSHLCGALLNCRHSSLTPLLAPGISVPSFSLLLHSVFEARRLRANKRRCVCIVRPLIGQSLLSCLNRGSVGDGGLPRSPNISISPFMSDFWCSFSSVCW